MISEARLGAIMDDHVSMSPDISEVQKLLDQHFGDIKGAISTCFSIQHECHKRTNEEAQRDLDVFKRAYKDSERAKQEAEERFEKEKKILLDELNFLRALEARERRVVVLIDGDGTIFHPSLLAMGKEGGHIAALKLTESVTRYLATSQFQLHVHIFHNKRGLASTLKRSGYQEAGTKFDDFIVGFNQAAERFSIIDAGELKEGSDHKMRAYLEDNIYSPQTLKVFFGGCHDNGYISTLNSFITSGFKEKLILLPGYSEMAVGIEKLGLPSLAIPELFLAEKMAGSVPAQTGGAVNQFPPPGLGKPITPPPTSRPSFPQVLREMSYAHVRRGSDPGALYHPAEVLPSLPSYRTAIMQPIPTDETDGANRPRASSESNSEESGLNGRTSPLANRLINHKIPVWKHDPPPCTLFYLANCKYGNECQYGHDYLLTDEDFELIRSNAKCNPCTSILRGDVCSWGDKCVYGHKCPQAPKCPRNLQGKCRFSADGMHTVVV